MHCRVQTPCICVSWQSSKSDKSLFRSSKSKKNNFSVFQVRKIRNIYFVASVIIFFYYFRRLATDKLDVNALLAKYARASKVDGVKFYSSKHGK